MYKKAVSYSFCLLCFTVSIGFSQGAYLKKGQTGYGAGLGFSSNREATGYDASFGYSSIGLLDIGISAALISLNQKFDNYDISAVAVSPGITFYAVKQDSLGALVSVAVSAGYEYDIYTSKALDQARLSLTGRYYVFGASIFRDINLSPVLYIQPSIDAAHAYGSTRFSDSYGGSLSLDHNVTTLGCSVSSVSKISSNNLLVIHPALAFGKEVTTFSISINFVFSNSF